MSNTFDLEETDGKFTATSHNFPDCSGEGPSEEEAIKRLGDKIKYIMQNYPKRFDQVILKQYKELVAKGEVPIGVYQGDAAFIRRF